jgi:hypothetical protein
MKPLGAIAIFTCLFTAGCEYPDRYGRRPGKSSAALVGKLAKTSHAPDVTCNATYATRETSFAAKCAMPARIFVIAILVIARKPWNGPLTRLVFYYGSRILVI